MFGQSVILVLFQLGGLGIMTFSVLLALLLRRKVSQTDSQQFQESYSTDTLSETFKAITFIFKLTLIIELIGAVILFLRWKPVYGVTMKAGFYAVFHAVSAFCNAGFSLFSDSVVGYGMDVPVIMTLSVLIIMGGLGFPVLFNIVQVKKIRLTRYKVQTKLALFVTIFF